MFDSDLKGVSKFRKAYPNNPIIGCLNINSLKEKIICLRDIISTFKIDVLSIDEPKLDTNIPDSFLNLEKIEIQKAVGK